MLEALTADQMLERIREHEAERDRRALQLYTELMALTVNDAFYTADHKIDDRTFYRVFTYRLASYSDFLLPSALEARGIMFEVAYADESKPIRLACRPQEKFFNIGENPMTMDLDYSQVIGSYIKEDGSLISTYSRSVLGMGEDFQSEWHWSLHFKSKTSVSSSQAVDAAAWVETQPELKERLIKYEQDGYTVNCEWCSPDNRIVVGYMEPRLIVLNARLRFSGEYVAREKLERDFGQYLVGLADPVAGEDDLRRIGQHTGYEGLILQFQKEYKVQFAKFKNSWYLHRHKTKDSINNVNHLFDAVLHEASDDLKTLFLEDPLATKRILEMEQLVIPLYNNFVRSAETWYEQHKHLERKDFAVKAQVEFPQAHSPLNKISFSAMMALYQGKNPNFKELLSKHKKSFITMGDSQTEE